VKVLSSAEPRRPALPLECIPCLAVDAGGPNTIGHPLYLYSGAAWIETSRLAILRAVNVFLDGRA
jgi:hypothetical protein